MHSRADGGKSPQAQQVQCNGAETSHHTSSIASVAMGILLELRVADPMPPLDAPAVFHQLQQCFWGRPDAREKQMAGVEGFAVSLSRGDDLNDPARAQPLFTDVPWCLFRLQRPGDVAAMADLMIHCLKRDLAFPLELSLDLAMQGPLVGLDRQQEVGALLLELSKNGFWVCKASAWISRPSRSSSPSSFLRTARSWFSPVE